MTKKEFGEIYSQISDVGQFIKFGRKRIAEDIQYRVRIIESNIDELERVSIGQTGVITQLSSENETQRSTITQLTSENETQRSAITQLSSENETQKSTINELELRNVNTATKLQLVSDILSSEAVPNESFVRFKQLIQNDFIEFANRESSLAEEAQAILQLQLIEKQIELLLNFSGINDKNIIAVGGGFSAGKSEFISSFFNDSEITLPIGVIPTTAIPTYVTPSSHNSIKGFSKRGGSINIEPSLYKKLSHDFVKSFSFNLKDIMPAMSIETPLSYKNICFIDTPGYNPSDTSDGFTNEDVDTAKEYLEQANVLLWLVGLDSNGTISTSGLKFLEELSLKNKKLFIIANKADLKSNEDIEDILDNFEETLDFADVEYAGISAYSAINAKEISFRKKSLLEFLENQDSPVEVNTKILKEKLNKVFHSYYIAISKDIEFKKNIRKELKSLELDFLETGFDKYENKVSNRISKIRKLFEVKELEKQLQNLTKVKNQILEEFNRLFP